MTTTTMTASPASRARLAPKPEEAAALCLRRPGRACPRPRLRAPRCRGRARRQAARRVRWALSSHRAPSCPTLAAPQPSSPAAALGTNHPDTGPPNILRALRSPKSTLVVRPFLIFSQRYPFSQLLLSIRLYAQYVPPPPNLAHHHRQLGPGRTAPACGRPCPFPSTGSHIQIWLTSGAVRVCPNRLQPKHFLVVQ
jgi:hypothetical protein